VQHIHKKKGAKKASQSQGNLREKARLNQGKPAWNALPIFARMQRKLNGSGRRGRKKSIMRDGGLRNMEGIENG